MISLDNLKPKKKSKKTLNAVLIHTPADAKDDTIMVKTVGRNDKCPCGSGKKAKNCCKHYKDYYYHKIVKQ